MRSSFLGLSQLFHLLLELVTLPLEIFGLIVLRIIGSHSVDQPEEPIHGNGN